MIEKALLSFEELSALLVEAEVIFNLRPLIYVYNDNDEQLLTPIHFLNFGKKLSFRINFFYVIVDGSRNFSLLKRKKNTSLY